MTSRQQKLFELKWEIFANDQRSDRLSYLSAALWCTAKGTMMEEDALEIITMLCPEFFKDDELEDVDAK